MYSRNSRWLAGTLCVLAAITACAAEPQARPLRVIVTLTQPNEDRDAIVQRARQAAGTPVRYAAAVSAEMHALELSCADSAACAQAMSRLRTDNAFFKSVERDGMKKKP